MLPMLNWLAIMLMICSLFSLSCLANSVSAVSLTTLLTGSGHSSQSSMRGLSFSIFVTISSCVLFIFVMMLLCCSSTFPKVFFFTLLISPLRLLKPEMSSMGRPYFFSSISRPPGIMVALLLTLSQTLVSSPIFPSTILLVSLVMVPKTPSACSLTFPNSSLTTSLPFSATISLTKVSPYFQQSCLKMLPAQQEVTAPMFKICSKQNQQIHITFISIQIIISNRYCSLKMDSIKATPKTSKSPHPYDHNSSNSRSLIKEPSISCQTCHQSTNASSILCYACCYAFACEHCFSQDHFVSCGRQFNKHPLSLFGGEKEENKGKKYGKNQKKQDRCRRCEDNGDYLEYCQQCKHNYCFECSQIMHSKGKFANHYRTVGNSPQKLKRLETVKTENIEEQSFSRKDRKQNQNFEYGFKGRQKLKNPPPNPMKKGRSIVKTPFQNQENTPIRHKRKSSMAMSDVDSKSRRNKQSSVNIFQNPWLICSRHSRIRNILTEAFDLVCFDCYEEIRSFVGKIKTVEWETWLGSQLQKETAFSFLTSVEQYVNVKNKELSVQFERYRSELDGEFNKKKQILQERYRNNLSNLEKWHHLYNQNLSSLNQKCEQFNQIKIQLEKTEDNSKYIPKINRLKSLVLYEEIVKMKKQFGTLQDQYQFKITQIGSDQFEEILKNFSFVRKKAESESFNPHKIVNKMGQSTQLRQSRISNTSMTSDRKCLKRQESMAKSSYYELSHSNNLVKRSASKDLRQQIPKDISQRILFPSSASDRKDLQKKSEAGTCNIRQKNSYFFQNPPQEKLNMKIKDADISDLGFKDVKYINLETIITEKLEKGGEKDKKEQLDISTPVIIDDTKTSYTAEMTEEGRREEKDNFCIVSDARLIQSITINSIHQNLPGNEGRGTVPSGHHNIQAVKNKRKSDYMEMRDRLRKPSIVAKMGK